MVSSRTIAIGTLAAAFAVFCGVQDRVVLQGAQRYADLQRDALAGRGPAVTIEQIVEPAVRDSVRQGLLWGGLVLAAGLGVAYTLRKQA